MADLNTHRVRRMIQGQSHCSTTIVKELCDELEDLAAQVMAMELTMQNLVRTSTMSSVQDARNVLELLLVAHSPAKPAVPNAACAACAAPWPCRTWTIVHGGR